MVMGRANGSRNPPRRISSRLGTLRVTAQSGWACSEVATPASVAVHAARSDRASVRVELDEPTAAYIAAHGEIGERFAQRELLSILGVPRGLSSPGRPIPAPLP